MGVGAIKVDFGEAAPLNGLYASGRTGFYEHNLYPLRYNKAAAEITQKVTGDTIIWGAVPGQAASVIRRTGAAMLKIPIWEWRRSFEPDYLSACRVFHSGVTISAVL